jgi:hypothetical protein
MNNSKLKLIFAFIAAIILTFGASIAFQSILADWQTPLELPPAGNTYPPIFNESGATDSALINMPTGVSGSLYVSNGNLIVNSGRVGIGTTSPVESLAVAGNIKAEKIYGTPDCRVETGEIENGDISNEAIATCDSNEYLLSGGGRCQTKGDNLGCSSEYAGWLSESRPDGNSWKVNCMGIALNLQSLFSKICRQAFVICCKK